MSKHRATVGSSFYLEKKMTIIDDEVEFVAEDDVSSPGDKPSLVSLIERGVNVKREQAILKDDLAEIADTAKDFYRVSKRDFNKLVKYSFEASITADIEELQAIQTRLENLVNSANQGELFPGDDSE